MWNLTTSAILFALFFFSVEVDLSQSVCPLCKTDQLQRLLHGFCTKRLPPKSTKKMSTEDWGKQKRMYKKYSVKHCYRRLHEQGSKLTFLFGSHVATNKKNFGCQIVNFGCQLILCITCTKTWFYTLFCMQEKSQLKSENNN